MTEGIRTKIPIFKIRVAFTASTSSAKRELCIEILLNEVL